MSYFDFIKESNRIEGINRDPRPAEIDEYFRFMELREVAIGDLVQFVKVYQPNAVLRVRGGLDVRIGNYYPPKGGVLVGEHLKRILKYANDSAALAYQVHHDYETLHPFTDGNGRSGRMLWMWMMREIGAPLGFLHTWYYQSLR